MGYKIYIYAFLLIAGIFGSILAERDVDREVVDQRTEFRLEVDYDLRLEGIILSHARPSLKKCLSSLYVKSLRPVFLLRECFIGYLDRNFPPPAIRTFFASILIHAP